MFWRKVQTHTSPRPSNCRNRNRHHPIIKSPTPKILAYMPPGSKHTKSQHPTPQTNRYDSTRTVTKIHVPTPHQGITNS